MIAQGTGYVEDASAYSGGDKTGNDRWYEQNVPKADRLYDVHLDELRKEGSIDGKEVR